MQRLKSDRLQNTTILDMDATSLAHAITSGKTTSIEVVKTYITHAKKINPTLNAIVEDRFSEALIEAEEADNLLKGKNIVGPLHGVPISVKESFDVKDMKTTGGLIHRNKVKATEHAYVVKQLTDAGAIIIGKTNTPILCFCQETDNKLYGRTNNPWDISRTAGGSSGGEGSLLSAGGAAVGIGSDIGGSIRVPSHFNGIVGFKSGVNQVSPAGHFPGNTNPLQQRMASFGPMGKSVRDMELLYGLISNNELIRQSIGDTKVDVLQGDNMYPLSDYTRDILNQVEISLNESYETKRTIPPFFEDSAQLWQEIMSIDGRKDIENLAFPKSNVFINYIKEKITKNTDIHPYLSWALIGSKVFKPSTKRIKKIDSIIEQGDLELANYLKNRLLIFPVYHTSAQKHGQTYKEIFSIKKTFLKYMPYLAYANVWGLPSLTIPVGMNNNVLPMAIQIIGLSGNEDRIFQLGKILEKSFQGYVRCSKWD